MSLTLLHLSDIHFSGTSDGGVFDLNANLRREIELDIVRRVEEGISPDGVLVTGDIAFSGLPEEYTRARDWLAKVTELLHLPLTSVMTVPGNHDVSWPGITGSELVQDMHRNLRGGGLELDARLMRYLRDPKAGPLLFDPMTNYVDFASQYGCEVGPEKPCWETDLTLEDGSVLRIRGLTSTLVSDSSDRQGTMILGQAQVNMLREPGVTYLTLSHHPIEWFADYPEIERMWTERARVQLFGHKHERRAYQVDQTLRLVAGAVHPERETGWVPRFNWVSLSVVTGPPRILRVEVEHRVWHDEGQVFGPESDKDGRTIQVYNLLLDAWTAPVQDEIDLDLELARLPDRKSEATSSSDEGVGRGESPRMDTRRMTTYRFLGLPYFERLRVAQELGLLVEDDKLLDGVRLSKRILERVAERELWDPLASAVGDAPDAANP